MTCSSRCVYQSDGVCTLESAASAGLPALGGALNVDPTAPYKTRTGNVTSNDGYLVIRGGSYYDNAEGCRSAARTYAQPWALNEQNGFRVVCRAGLD